MNKLNLAAAILLGLLGLPCPQAWAGPGQSGADFLNIIPSPRVVAMGEAGTALVDDHLSAFSVNPAGLGRLRYPEAAFLYDQWFEGISLQNLSYAHPTKEWGTLGVSGTWLQVKSIPGFDNSGGAAGEVKVQDMAIKLAYARRFGVSPDRTHGLFVGAGLNYVKETLETATASTVLGDLGILYARRFGTSSLSAGASLESLGQGLKFDAQRDPAPARMRLGLAYTVPVLDDPLTIVWDARKSFYEDISHGIGLEYTALRSVSWRLGWTTDQDLGSGMRVGIGLKLKILSVDYALAQFGSLGTTHRIALSARFGAPIDKLPPTSYRVEEGLEWHMDKGNRLIRETRYYEAALEFNEVLRLDPHNKAALRNLRLVRDLMERAR